MTIFKRIFRRTLSLTITGKKVIAIYHIVNYLSGKGWLLSVVRNLAVDKFGDPLPWYTYPAISFLVPRVRDNMKVFEYGSGQSTLWWAKKASMVVSCEHNPDWFNKMRRLAPSNVTYMYRSLGGSYENYIAESQFEGSFDLVIIDGRNRVDCTLKAVPALKQDGVILFDNSDREKYEAAYQHLLENGFGRLDFWGIGPCGASEWCTSIFYRKNNCLGI